MCNPRSLGTESAVGRKAEAGTTQGISKVTSAVVVHGPEPAGEQIIAQGAPCRCVTGFGVIGTMWPASILRRTVASRKRANNVPEIVRNGL